MAEGWSREELALLGATPLFQGASAETIRRAAEDSACRREDFPRETVIYSPESFRRCLGVLLRGRARVTKGALVVSTLEAGALFGAAALFHRRERYESAITALCPCTVAFFPEEQVIGLLSGDPLLCANYIRYLSERIHFLSRKLESLTAPGAAERLASCLLESAGAEGALSCSATELSRCLDLSRASLYRAFQTLEEAGAIRREGKTIVILDRKVLESKNGGTIP